MDPLIRLSKYYKSFPKKLELFKSLLLDKTLDNTKSIALTGGEPFLITNLDDYYLLARKYAPRSYINISTNGYFTDRILKFLKIVDVKRTSVTISYDGVKSHDSIRGVEGSAKRLLETIKNIKKKFPRLKLSLKLTITPENYGEILATAEQCKNLEIPFRFKTMEKLNCHQSRFPSEIDEPNYNKEMLNSIIEQAKKILKLNIKTNRKYIKKLIKKYSGKKVSCNCSTRTLFIGIDGQVFLCRKKEAIGDINKEKLHDIWNSEKKDKIVQEMKECKGDPISLSYINN
jgi:MoaA/NifB/PqqE/SkfB family radical SAM enzyme